MFGVHFELITFTFYINLFILLDECLHIPHYERVFFVFIAKQYAVENVRSMFVKYEVFVLISSAVLVCINIIVSVVSDNPSLSVVSSVKEHVKA